MLDDAKARALADAKRASLIRRDIKAAREVRRKTFARAQKTGSSLAEIGDAVGLHPRVGEILRGNRTPVGIMRRSPRCEGQSAD